MDERTFDDLARSFATRTNRRRMLQRGVLAAAAAGGLLRAPAEAARRGKPAKLAICNPDGAGGYARAVIDPGLLPAYLAAGAMLDNGCCSGLDCTGGDACSTATCNRQTGSCSTVSVADGTLCTPAGPVDLCRAPSTCQQGVCSRGIEFICAEVGGGCVRSDGCNPATGECDYPPIADGSQCNRGGGCAAGVCAAGVCLDPTPRECPSDACQYCAYDACQDGCTCTSVGCAAQYPECQTALCDPDVGCVFTNINEGGDCIRDGQPGGTCIQGVCLFLV